MADVGYGQSIADGQFTSTIYGLIRDGKCADAIPLLVEQLHWSPQSRAALSLLGYCYYYVGQFAEASEMYEALVRLLPDNVKYRFYYAQSLYKASIHPEATKVAMQLNSPGEQEQKVGSPPGLGIMPDMRELASRAAAVLSLFPLAFHLILVPLGLLSLMKILTPSFFTVPWFSLTLPSAPHAFHLRCLPFPTPQTLYPPTHILNPQSLGKTYTALTENAGVTIRSRTY